MKGLSYRHSKRLGLRYRAEGTEGLKHRSVGAGVERKKPKKFRERVLRLVGKKYAGEEGERFGPTLAAEHLASDDQVEVMCRLCGGGCCQRGYGVGHGNGGRLASGGNAQEHVAELCSWMEVFTLVGGTRPAGCLTNWWTMPAAVRCARRVRRRSDGSGSVARRVKTYGVPVALYADWKNVHVRESSQKRRCSG